MASIELIMFPVHTADRTKGWFPHIQWHKKRGWWPLFLRPRFMNHRVNWEDIQNWVAQGYHVTIRPPTDTERKAAQPEIDRCMKLVAETSAAELGSSTAFTRRNNAP